MTTNKNKSGSTYTKEFRDNAVRLALSRDRSRSAIARELGLPEWELSDWVRSSERLSVKRAGKSGIDDVLALQNELKRLRLENEILKKAAAFFANDLT
jgi:transposase